jgi:hypothetical protein
MAPSMVNPPMVGTIPFIRCVAGTSSRDADRKKIE